MQLRLIPLLLLAAALAAPACGRAPARNLVLVSVDTVRPDRLGFGGGARPTSPSLDALAAEARVFESAWSASGWTLPSMATLLTGRRPREHGATHYGLGLREGLPTLASLLRARGYDTRGFVSHVLLGPSYGLDRGFARYDDRVLQVGRPHAVATGAALTDRVLESLERDTLQPPFFLWVHYFDPHFRYLRHDGLPAFGRRRIDRYDGELLYSDRQIGRLLDALRERGLYEQSVVIFTSDHGEEFGEHGGRYHDTLHEEVLRVPLLVRAPGLAPGRSAEPALQIDVLPTALGLLGIETPGDLPGRDLLAGPAPDRPFFFERDLPLPFRQRGVRRGDHKLYVIDLVPVEVDAGREAPGRSDYKPRIQPGTRLYDLARDPDETRDLYAEGDPISEQLLALLLEHFDEPLGPANPVEVAPELIEKLRELGYLH